jgi:integrase
MILDFAVVKDWRPKGDNPARWSRNLEYALSGDKHVVKHLAALDWRTIAGFMAELSNVRDNAGALPLRFCILTAARTEETLGAKWSEIDWQAKAWIIPGARMKEGLEHRVPLSTEAQAVLNEAAALRVADSDYVFPGTKPGKPLSESALLDTARAISRTRITAHGFRSSFSDWGGETGKPRDIIETSLAHKVGGKVQQAYQRGDLLVRRRKLMQQWADYCMTPRADADNVVSLHGGDAAGAVS